jgi:hypothetical protein
MTYIEIQAETLLFTAATLPCITYDGDSMWVSFLGKFEQIFPYFIIIIIIIIIIIRLLSQAFSSWLFS